jgi:hypothetical protein
MEDKGQIKEAYSKESVVKTRGANRTALLTIRKLGALTIKELIKREDFFLKP